MDCSTLSIPVLHHLLEFAKTQVYWVSDAIQPSHPLSSPSPLVLNLSQHQGLFQWAGKDWGQEEKGMTEDEMVGFSRQEYWSGFPCPPPGDLPNPGIELRCPTLQADSLITEPWGKPKNIGVGSLTFLQEIFPTQKLNWGLLHCRWILYQLSYNINLCVQRLFILIWYPVILLGRLPTRR